MRWMFAVAVAAALLTGCKSSCRQLSEKLCDCTLNSNDKTACLQRAASSEANAVITAEDEDACRQLYDDCDCRLVDTPAGKVKCGLARDPDAND